jgi:reprolysin-like metallo-peptidase family M12B
MTSRVGRLCLVTLTALTLAGPARAQVAPSQLWHAVPTAQVSSPLKSWVADLTPDDKGSRTTYREFDIDPASLKAILGGIRAKPASGSGFLPFDSALPPDVRTQITIPSPDGRMLLFMIEDSNTLSPVLAAKHPEIRTFRGISAEGPASELRMEITPTGLHAMVRGAGTTFYVEPLKFDLRYLDTQTRYASFLSSRLRPPGRFRCVTGPSPRPGVAGRPAAVPDLLWGDTYRTYRLAVGATAFYTKAAGGTRAAALAAIVQTVELVNSIYERELSVHLELIPDEDKIISTDPNDGLHNDDADALLNDSQALLDRVVGDRNYDIGHMLSTGAGGKAQVGAVGRSGVKAMGVTGADNPTGEYFTVDYVAHEMGHQFGANHTFNGNQSFCASNRNDTTAYEPGSGSTILGYAGVCGTDDLQQHSDRYLHTISIFEITRYISGPGDTPRKVATGNSFPTLKPPAAAILPARTMFSLTAGVPGTGPTDQWTYTWEEFDLGPQAPLSAADDGRIPLFRSIAPGADGTRIFQSPLPQLDRTSRYRVTARNQRPTGGVIATASTTLTFVASAGPFRVTQPDGSAISAGPYEVRWNAAHTDVPPVNANKVRLLISADGGSTFPRVLANNVPNNGSARVSLPAGVNPAVVRVQSVGNYFFADSKPTMIR